MVPGSDKWETEPSHGAPELESRWESLLEDRRCARPMLPSPPPEQGRASAYTRRGGGGGGGGARHVTSSPRHR